MSNEVIEVHKSPILSRFFTFVQFLLVLYSIKELGWWALGQLLTITLHDDKLIPPLSLTEFYFQIVFPLVLVFSVHLYKKHLLSITYRIHPHKIEAEDTWMSRKSAEVPLRHVRAVHMNQSLIGRWFGFGHVSVDCSGSFGGDLVLSWVDDPRQVWDWIRERVG